MARDAHGTYLLIVNGTAGAGFNPEDPAARRAYYDAVCLHVA